MKYTLMIVVLMMVFYGSLFAGGEKAAESAHTRQYASGKVGFYSPSDGLNNGLLFGIDGITEFTNYNFILTGAADLYLKQSISIFKDPQPGGTSPPDVTQQQIVLLPLHVNFAYTFFQVEDADTRGYLGVGGGYYFYFYSATYRSSSGGILGGALTTTSDAKNGGNVFGSVFARVLINQIFLEPRWYIAAKSEDTMGGNSFVVNPSGFAVTLGFQYH